MTLDLGTQTHFGQGWNTALLNVANSLGADMIRDSLPWAMIETTPGVFNFAISQTAWLDTALANGTPVILTFANTNPLYDRGFTVHSDAGREAFAHFVVVTLQRYPNVTAVEIGNEYNSSSFVTGPIAAASASLRDNYYAKLIEAVDTALDRAHIQIELVGGATHSIPVDYFADLKALGTLDHLDSISIHPYSTPPEQLEDQIAVLRSVIGDDMPIRVTEFGSNFASINDAPAYLAKMISVMGAADIESASWYALARQSWFPNMELWNQTSGTMTPAGQTFALFDQLLSNAPTISHLETSDSIYLYAFGDHAAVLWGTTGRVTLANGVTAYDLSGRPITNFDGHISADVPIILRSTGIFSSNSVQFSGGTLVGDSFDQFDVTNTQGGTTGFEGPWSYFAESGTGRLIPLYTMGGGLAGGEVWTPYLGTSWLRPLEVNATTITPVDFASGQNPASRYAIVERYTSETSGLFTLSGHYDVGDSTKDGVDLTIRINGTVISTQHIYNTANGHQYDFAIEHVSLAAGDRVEFVLSSGRSAKGDVTARHIQITAEQAVGQVAEPAIAPVSIQGEFSLESGPVLADLGSGRATIDGHAQTLSALNLTGSAFADRLYGDGNNNTISGGNGDDRLYGRSGQDILIGGAGNDRLDGGAGADRMAGGADNDDYFVDNAQDTVIELASGGTQDTVRASVSFALGAQVESLILTGRGDIAATGNALNNVIKGNRGDNVISGGGGSDRLWGGNGADHFVFDSLESSANKDTIADFINGVDSIVLDRHAFSALSSMAAGELGHLAYGTRAATPDDHLFYNRSTATLYYDPDGSGAATAIAIASLRSGLDLQASDILLA